MRRAASRLALALACLLAALPAASRAADAALVLGNGGYENLGRLPDGDGVASALDGISRLGFDVSAAANAGLGETASALSAFMGKVPEADRLLVVLSGRFVTDGARTWYMTVDAPRPTILTLGRTAISVESVLAVMARSPSRAVLLLGVDPGAEGAFDPWLREGVGEIEVPQGVTVLTATPQDAASFLGRELAVPRGDLPRLLTENGRVAAEGYLPRGFAFMPAAPEAAEPPPVEVVPEAEAAAEEAAWRGAVALDTLEAYRGYLRSYPGGPRAAEAEAAIESILTEPNREARLAEERLGLSPESRRVVQERLAILDFDPRGIDGVFGPGTRAAIANWQQENGLPQTGYLSGEDLARLDAQATRRAAEIEAEAERRRQAALQADRAFWEETGARGDEAGLRAYLDRYPEGRFAEDAGARLAEIEDGRRRAAAEAEEAAGEERAVWERAREADRRGAYERYLEVYPEGRFAEEARSRIRAIEERGQAGERALGLNALTARVVEERLDALGFETGEVDGEFDRDTRRAIRRLQQDRDLPVTGYLDEPTLVRLLAASLGEELGE